VAVLHRIVLALAVLPHHAHNLVKSVLLAEVVQTALVQHVRYLKVAKSVIHAGFGLLHKSAINREFVHASLNQISQMMSRVKNSKRVFARSC
jgi:hypothetical protein